MDLDADGTEQWVQAAGSAGGGGSNVSISPTKPDSAVEGDLWVQFRQWTSIHLLYW